ncbi:ankyrin repeat-containing domain protein, partial [Cladochytrium replicatum]
TLLHFAARTRSVDMISLLLLHGADANARNVHMRTPLFECVESVDCVKLLLESGADPSGLKHGTWTPLMQACIKGATDVVDVLLATGQAFPFLQNKDGWTVMHL